ncbi:response regulator transcription factor [Cupriavidus necator]|uniref:response regulator transcription factor n=1 Tax=Cupriavidus necator TaxID=106590 RepID=UPI0005B50B80|nr:response regulator transcription factor [Cupriavidus necator]
MKIAALQADSTLAVSTQQTLRLGGHQCTRYLSGRSMIGALRSRSFDLLMLDCDTPGIPALEVLAWVRRTHGHKVPVMLAGASTEEAFVVSCLAQGADSYLPKPLRTGELAASVLALLRRTRLAGEACDLTHGAFRFATAERRVWVHGKPVLLAPKEFDLAVLLFRNLGSLVLRQAMVDQVWRYHVDPASRTVDSHLSRVRTKLALWPHNGVRLSSVYELGSRLDAA